MERDNVAGLAKCPYRTVCNAQNAWINFIQVTGRLGLDM